MASDDTKDDKKPRPRGGLLEMLGLGQARKAGEDITSRARKLDKAIDEQTGATEPDQDSRKGRQVDFDTSYGGGK